MIAALTVVGLFIALAWTQKCFLDHLLAADLRPYRTCHPDSD